MKGWRGEVCLAAGLGGGVGFRGCGLWAGTWRITEVLLLSKEGKALVPTLAGQF